MSLIDPSLRKKLEAAGEATVREKMRLGHYAGRRKLQQVNAWLDEQTDAKARRTKKDAAKHRRNLSRAGWITAAGTAVAALIGAVALLV